MADDDGLLRDAIKNNFKGINTGHPLHDRFWRAAAKDPELLAKYKQYKGRGSALGKELVRNEFLTALYNQKEKSKIQKWWRTDTTKGTYKGFPALVVSQGGWGSEWAIQRAINIVESCVELAGDFVMYNRNAKDWVVLELEVGFKEAYQECWKIKEAELKRLKDDDGEQPTGAGTQRKGERHADASPD